MKFFPRKTFYIARDSVIQIFKSSIVKHIITLLIILSVALLIVGPPLRKHANYATADMKKENIHTQVSKLITIPTDTVVYHLQDKQHVQMDTAQVIQEPGKDAGYLAVYNQVHRLLLASSEDLVNWEQIRVLSFTATNPTIVEAPDGGVIIGFEKWDNEYDGGYSQISLQYYQTFEDLVAGNPPAKLVDLPRKLSSCNEGTPNIYSISFLPDVNHSVIEVGFHYHLSEAIGTCLVSQADREGKGILRNFNQKLWTPHPDNSLNQLCEKAKLYACGGRDSFGYNGREFTLVEGWMIAGDWSTWRIYIMLKTSPSCL